jgi:hypothetical protein
MLESGRLTLLYYSSKPLITRSAQSTIHPRLILDCDHPGYRRFMADRVRSAQPYGLSCFGGFNRVVLTVTYGRFHRSLAKLFATVTP